MAPTASSCGTAPPRIPTTPAASTSGITLTWFVSRADSSKSIGTKRASIRRSPAPGSNNLRVGVFTPLLSQLPLDGVLKKLKSYQIDAVELGTGNYPGDAHCKLSMLDDAGALATFRKTISDH